MSHKLSGNIAIAHAQNHGAQLHKYADAVDGAREVTLDEALEIAAIDPMLLWCEPSLMAHADRIAANHGCQIQKSEWLVCLAVLAGDIGPKRAGSFLAELRGIGQRIAGFGAVLGEERVARARESVRLAIVELETVLGDDYTGISARFAGVWDEIAADRRRSGGVL